MSFFLLIDGSELISSVAVADKSTYSVSPAFFSSSGSENLYQVASDAISGAGITMHDLNGVAINAGPGSYTGLRISGAFAKGICLGLTIPLYALSGLRALAAEFYRKFPSFDGPVIAMLDARRDEIFAAAFKHDLCVLQEGPYILDSDFVQKFSDFPKIALAGSGAQKALPFFQFAEVTYHPAIKTDASSLAHDLISESFTNARVNLGEFEPNYLKPFYFPQAPKGNNPLTL